MNTIYQNFIIENKIEDLLTTKVDINNYLTPDYDLVENAGMTKKIHRYTATSGAEDLAMGVGNSKTIEVSFADDDYDVLTTQARFAYYDEEAMADPMVVDTGVRALASDLVNDLSAKAIAEMGKTSLEYTVVDGWSFGDFADAIALLNTEDEAGLFCLVNPAQVASIRKALGASLQYSEGFARTGYIGSVCGVPVIVSKAVPVGEAYLGTKEAVRAFIKKGVEVVPTRDENTRQNTIYARKVAVVALVDETKMVKMAE